MLFKGRILYKRNQFALGLKKFSSLKSLSGNTVWNNGQESTNCSDLKGVHVKTPMDAIMGILSACEIHSILFQAKQFGVPIQKIEINAKAEYDSDIYLEKKAGKNTYNWIEVNAEIYSNEPDKAKLKKAVEKGEQLCPVLSTLRLTGTKIKSNIKYL